MNAYIKNPTESEERAREEGEREEEGKKVSKIKPSEIVSKKER